MLIYGQGTKREMWDWGCDYVTRTVKTMGKVTRVRSFHLHVGADGLQDGSLFMYVYIIFKDTLGSSGYKEWNVRSDRGLLSCVVPEFCGRN